MKAILFCTSYIRDQHAWQSRYQRWLDYYSGVPIEAAKTILIDDGSPFLPPAAVITTVADYTPLPAGDEKNLIIRFDANLGRHSTEAYPGWWRSFLHSVTVAKALNADKIIHIESDAYILSPRLVDFINATRSGWHVLWAQRYQFPETAVQVICRDQFAVFEQLKADHSAWQFADIAERLLPFTSVHRQFKGDRYSEFSRNRGIFRSRKFNRIKLFQHDYFREPIPADGDFATQVVSRQRVAFRHTG